MGLGRRFFPSREQAQHSPRASCPSVAVTSLAFLAQLGRRRLEEVPVSASPPFHLEAPAGPCHAAPSHTGEWESYPPHPFSLPTTACVVTSQQAPLVRTPPGTSLARAQLPSEPRRRQEALPTVPFPRVRPCKGHPVCITAEKGGQHWAGSAKACFAGQTGVGDIKEPFAPSNLRAEPLITGKGSEGPLSQLLWPGVGVAGC